MAESFEASCGIDAPATELLAWHTRPGAFERLTPPWEHASATWLEGDVVSGGRVRIAMRAGLARFDWMARHSPLEITESGGSFVDEAERSPFRAWKHHHVVRGAGDGSTLTDRIEYALPWGPLGRLAHGAVRRRIERAFRFRHTRTQLDVERHWRVARGRQLRIAITGTSGFVGSELVAFLRSGGHDVRALVRRQPTSGEIAWDPARGTIDAQALDGMDAVIHLAGENVAARRWNDAHKARILDSRRNGTQLLARTLATLPHKPSVWISASAVGIYGEHRSEAVDERSTLGDDFLARVCQQWEQAAARARDAGIRVVHPRLGLVLGGRGGPLPQLTLPLSLGVGGRLGSGRQMMPWIAIDDVVGAIHHMLFHDTLEGPVNVTAPKPVSNAEFVAYLGRVLRRPPWLPAPAWALRLVLGEFAGQVLGGQRPVSTRLETSGFEYRFDDLEKALRFELGRV